MLRRAHVRMSPHRRAWLQIHFCTLLWGFTAVVGKLIELPALPLVWWRMVLVAGLLLLWPGFWRGARRIPPRLVAICAGTGAVIALHWVTFYGSIKLSNASVAATCLALTPVFLAFLEPVLTARRFDVRELLFAVAALPGVALVVGGTPDTMHEGIAVGVFSSFTVAVFALLNQRFSQSLDALAVTGIEMAGGALALTALGPLLPASQLPWQLPDPRDATLLVTLAVCLTLLPFALWLVALRRLTAFSTALAINMEPVYAIALASLLLGEQRELSPWFYAGVAVVVAVAFGHPLLQRRTTSPP